MTHESPHSVCPGKQSLRQPRPVHTWLEPHCVVQLPQEVGEVRGTQAPPQLRKPVGQSQVPPVQAPPAQELPQAPQCCGSVVSRAQTPSHTA